MFKLCSPPKDFAPLNNYAYDRSRIEKIDGQRHNMIHENGFGTPLPTLEEDLPYLEKTRWFLMDLVNKKHGLMIGNWNAAFMSDLDAHTKRPQIRRQTKYQVH